MRINKESLILVASLVLIEVEDFRERIRRDNKLDPDSKQKLFEILDEISNGMEEVLEFTPGEDQEDSEVDSSQALEWFSKYRTSFSNKLDEVLDPTLLGETSVPLSIILGCGAIGTLIGGAVGLGAGSVLGHLIARQLKPGQAADKLKDILSNDNDGNIDSREDT